MMEALGWAGHPVAARLGLTLVHFLWQGAALVLLAAFVLLALRRATARYAGLLAVLGAMALCLPVTFVLLAPRPAAEMPPLTGPVLAAPAAPQDIVAAPSPGRDLVRVKGPGPRPTGPAPSELFSVERAQQWAEPHLAWVVALWAAGVLFLSLRFLVRAWVVRRMVRGLPPAGAEWHDCLALAARRLAWRRPVALLASASARVPLVIGCLRPAIVLPVGLLTGLTPEQCLALLAHELAHLRRHDQWVNLVQSAIELLLFYHPAVWWVSRAIRAEREHCCDDLAVAVSGDASGYLQALAWLEERRGRHRQPALAASGSPLLARARRLAGGETRPSPLAAAVALAVVVALFAAGSLTRASSSKTRLRETPGPAREPLHARPQPSAARPPHPEPASPIQLSDLYDARDVPFVVSASDMRDRLPDRQYLADHAARPEVPELRREFREWASLFLAPHWLPRGTCDRAVYLRQGTGREARQNNHFHASYQVDGTQVVLQGFAGRVQVYLKPPASPLPARVAAHLAEAAARSAAGPAGRVGVPESITASPELKAYLRALAEQYVPRRLLPDGKLSTWEDRLSGVSALNRGIWLDWAASARPAGTRQPEYETSCTLWTNGRVVRLTLEHHGVSPRALAVFTRAMPKPRRAPVAPLNPQAVELWDMADWKGPGGPVDDPRRATHMMVRVSIKAPYGPAVSEQDGAPKRPPRYGNDMKYPMSPLQWRIAEFAALANATAFSVSHGGASSPEGLRDDLTRSHDLRGTLRRARAARDNLQTIANRFASLRYPVEVEAERQAVLEALRSGVRQWDLLLDYWRPLLRDSALSDRAVVEAHLETLNRQLEAPGLSGWQRDLHEASNISVRLFQKFGME